LTAALECPKCGHRGPIDLGALKVAGEEAARGLSDDEIVARGRRAIAALNLALAPPQFQRILAMKADALPDAKVREAANIVLSVLLGAPVEGSP